VLCEGTGEANRAVDVALGTGLPDERPLFEPGEEAIGTGRGLEGEAPSLGVDIVLGGRAMLLSWDRGRVGCLIS
jgi:hypothetical protein